MAKGGFLHLPHADTCRQRAARTQVHSGDCPELYETLRTRVAQLPAHRREMALLFDEINIVGDVAFKIVNKEYEFFGFIDCEAATPNIYAKETENPTPIPRAEHIKRQIATHALVFQVAELSGLTQPLRFRQVVGIHGVTSLNADILDTLFWQTVRNLHFIADVRVVVSICDGASCNRLFQKMNTHQMGRRTPNTFQPGQAWCPNPFVDEENAKIWFMSDPAHWIKKVVTHWEKSKYGGPRHLLIPDFLVQLVLVRCPPPAGYQQRVPEWGMTCGIEFYCRVFGRLYMLMAASHQQHYTSLTDPRLQELRDILTLVRAWHTHNAQLPGKSAKERSSHGFSHQLFWDTQMMIEGFLGLLEDLQHRHQAFDVRVRMLNQDSLESLFGRIRMACGSGRDPNLLKVLQAIPRAEAVALATAGIRGAGPSADKTNSGQAGQVGAAPKGYPGAWVDRLRIQLPPNFAQLCQAAAQSPSTPSPHEVLWQTLRELQAADEARPLGQGKLMYWLTTSKHINKTGFSRMRVGLAIAVLCGPKEAAVMADVLQLLRYQ